MKEGKETKKREREVKKERKKEILSSVIDLAQLCSKSETEL